LDLVDPFWGWETFKLEGLVKGRWPDFGSSSSSASWIFNLVGTGTTIWEGRENL